jgi:hypothetical protein
MLLKKSMTAISFQHYAKLAGNKRLATFLFSTRDWGVE